VTRTGALDHRVIDLWEAGLTMTPAARAVLLLEALGHRDVADWPVGRRDQALLAGWCAGRGTLQAMTDCPACGASLDLDLDPAAFAATAEPGRAVTVEQDGWRVVARPPVAGDLARLSLGTEDGDRRTELLDSCVIEARRDGLPVEPGELPEPVVAAVEEALAAADPAACTTLALQCPECGAAWSGDLDPVRFAWEALEENARRLAADVHALARAYGWSEQEILRLTPFRRHLYLSAVQA
jgi:hypothetical protein